MQPSAASAVKQFITLLITALPQHLSVTAAALAMPDSAIRRVVGKVAGLFK
jgi:hypothetical protein